MLRLVNREDLMGKYKNSRLFNNIAWVILRGDDRPDAVARGQHVFPQ